MMLPVRGSKAFTLLELIVVIVILGILAAIAIPTFQKVIEKSKDNSAKQTLQALDREAQALAAFDNVQADETHYAAAAEDLNAFQTGLLAAGTYTVATSETEAASGSKLGLKVTSGGVGVSLLSGSGNCVTLKNEAGNVTLDVLKVTASQCTGAVAWGGTAALVTAPGAATAVTAAAGNASASVAFTPGSTGGGTVTYTVTSTPGNVTATGSTSPVTVSGLTNGTAYTFTVTSTNVAGSATSAASNSVTPQAPPPTYQALGWGLNDYSQLGDGTVTTRSTPVPNVVLSKDPEHISVGNRHGCAVIDGGAWCWGSNANGQLGDGTTTSSPAAAVQVSGLTSGVTHISAGVLHSCAVHNGAAKCWGTPANGRLGNGVDSWTVATTPQQVTGLTSGVTAVDAGDVNGCAVHDDAVKCWGYNENGQVGDGTITQRNSPVQVTGLTSGATSVNVGGRYFACATHNGAAKCWGQNLYGQLGDGTTNQSTTPVQVSGLTSNVTSISVGYNHACAVHNGAAKCWGLNDDGRLGNSTVTNSSTPVQVTDITAGATQISAGANHSCVVHNAAAKCWGSGFDGRLGNGSNNTLTSPFQVSGLTEKVHLVDAGLAHNVALRSR